MYPFNCTVDVAACGYFVFCRFTKAKKSVKGPPVGSLGLKIMSFLSSYSCETESYKPDGTPRDVDLACTGWVPRVGTFCWASGLAKS
jgi:hypothetical protein